MKLIFAISLLFFAYNADATKYYVANAGSNSNNGTSTGTPFQTIAKVISVVVKNDSVYFNDGDTFNEKFTIPCDSLYFGSYGTGNKPVITGFQTISVTNTSGNIWSGTATNAPPALNMVLINGQIAHKARYPNNSYLTYLSSTVNYIKTSSLTGTPNYAGAEAVVRVVPYITAIQKISSQNIDTLFFQTQLPFAATYGYYFLQNATSFLDSINEYTYDSTSKLLSIYSVGAPTVQYSNSDTLIYIQNKKSITFDGLKIIGSNSKGIRYDTCRSITIKNCTLNQNGGEAIYPRVSPQSIISYDSISNSFNDGIFAARNSDTTDIDNCYVFNSGVIEGMAQGLNGSGINIYSDGLKNTIIYNRVDSSGYIGISLEGTNSLVEYNYVTNALLKKDDGGGIYAVGNSSLAGTIIRKNIVGNIFGVGGSIAAGIYIDNNANDILTDSNNIYNCKTSGLFCNIPLRDTFRYNTSYNSIGAGFYYILGGGNNVIVKNNIFYSGDSTQVVLFSAYYNETPGIVYDYNYYLRPLKQTSLLKENNTLYSLPAWQSTFPIWDTHSSLMPGAAISTVPLFFYNPTKNDSTVIFSGTMVTATGIGYTNSAVIHPFQSLLLFTSLINHKQVGSLKFN